MDVSLGEEEQLLIRLKVFFIAPVGGDLRRERPDAAVAPVYPEANVTRGADH